jgi:SRSO17 transposase
MIKKLFLLTVINVLLFSESFLVSNIPLPTTKILNLDPYPCDEVCLKEYLDNGMIFSFLAYTNDTILVSKELQETRNIYVSVLNLGSFAVTKKIKIALLLPYKKIGKYASTTTNATFAYLMARNLSFELKSYDINDENIDTINEKLNEIKNDGFNYIIAPLTQKGVNNIISLNPTLNIYFPTINKKDIDTYNENLYFGGIDYQAQSQKLLKKASSPLVIFYDNSPLGQKLANMQEEDFLNMDFENLQNVMLEHNDKEKKVIKFSVASRTTNLENKLKNNPTLEDSSVMLDTPLVKSGMIMSQLTLFDVNTTNILSTQINYNPLLLSITQYQDRKNMFIANSITQQNAVFTQTNALLGNDIVYDWINYSTTIGIDFFVSKITNAVRKYNLQMQDNQIVYPIELIKPKYSKFETYLDEDTLY